MSFTFLWAARMAETSGAVVAVRTADTLKAWLRPQLRHKRVEEEKGSSKHKMRHINDDKLDVKKLKGHFVN